MSFKALYLFIPYERLAYVVGELDQLIKCSYLSNNVEEANYWKSLEKRVKTKVNLGIMDEILDERASEPTIEDPMTEE